MLNRNVDPNPNPNLNPDPNAMPFPNTIRYLHDLCQLFARQRVALGGETKGNIVTIGDVLVRTILVQLCLIGRICMCDRAWVGLGLGEVFVG